MTVMSEGEYAYQEYLCETAGADTMGERIQGVIEKMHTASGTGKKGKWTKYSAVVNGGWINFGFDDPGFSEGDEIDVLVEENQYGKEVKKKKLIAKADKPANTSGNSSSGGFAGYNPQGQAWGNACNVAASLIETLTAVDGLPLTASQGKANKAKRFEEIMEIYDKLRVKLYNDSQDVSRVLDNVADFGNVVTNEPKPLPDGDVSEESEELSVDEDGWDE